MTPVNVQYIDGDLLTAPVDYICHQCNCTSTGAAGLAAAIFSKWPEANTYRNKISRVFGSYSYHSTVGGKVIINLYSQHNPGRADDHGVDSYPNRLNAFRRSLTSFLESNYNFGMKKIGLPYMIGCGLGGGNWADYEAIIHQIAEKFPDKVFVVVRKT